MCHETDMPGSWGSVVALGVLLGTTRAVGPAPDRGRDREEAPRERPAAPSPMAERHEHRTVTGPAIEFEQALGLSADTPGLEGLQEAGAIKQRLDREIPRLVQGPQITLMPGVRVIPEGNRGWELQGTATQAWSLEGYGPKRHRAAAAETAVLDAEARALALERRLEAAHAWIELHAAELELALARQELALARARVERLEAARAGGVGTRMGVVEARADAAELRALVIELVGLVHDLGLVLARETGADAHRPLRTRGDHPEPPLPSDDELRRIFAAVDQLPVVAVERLRARALRAEAVESAASRGHQLVTGLAVQREATTDLILFGVVGMNFAGDRGQRQRASAVAAARRAEGRSEQQALELQAALSIVLHDLHHARERVEIVRDEVLPTFESLEQAQSLAVDLGEGTEPNLLLARRRRLAVARRLVALQAELVWARVQAWLYLEAFAAAGVGADAERAP